MKKFYFILVFLGFSILVSAQDLGGTPVEGLIPITRISDATETPTDSISNANPVATTAATAVQNYVPTPTGPSTEVGITEGQLSVSLTGGANYTIPIAVPPGINGVVPQVSLAYNSQGGNGMAGYGWNISGVSAITRIPRTKFHDGIVGGVNLDANDRFALDGQRLILKSGVYGAAGAVYETENFSNIKITSLGVNPLGAIYGPASFLVEYPDGSKAVYGDTTNSRSVNTWSIRYWQNAQSVRISYTYILANNNLSIEYINYGNTSANASINQIKFVYKTRQRPEQSYVGGQSFLIDTILSEIQVSGNSVGFRNYILAHNTTTLGYERLERVTEKSGNNTKAYNPTVFSYDNTSESISYAGINTSLSVGNINSNNSATVPGDFDGDEKMEFLLYPTTGTNKKKKYWFFNESDSFWGLNIGYEHNVGDFEEIFPVSWLTWSNKLWSKQGWAVAKKTNTNYTFTVYCAGTYSPIMYQYEKVVNFPTASNVVILKKIISGDFNGDGLTDVMAIDNTTTSKKVYFVDLKRDNTTNFLTYSGELVDVLNTNAKVETLDFNNDSKSDFMVLTSGIVRVYSLNELNQLVLLTSYSDAGLKVDKRVLLGDYNGDAKTDFVIPQEAGQDKWWFYLSNGTSFVKNEKSIGENYTLNYTTQRDVSNDFNKDDIEVNTIEYTYLASDMNADGKTDIIRIYNKTYTRTDFYTIWLVRVYTGTRDGGGVPIESSITLFSNLFSNSSGLNFSKQTTLTSGIYHYPIPIITNHLQPNFGLSYSLLTNNTIQSYSNLKNNRTDTRLLTITTGNGVRESITYKPLTDDRFLDQYSYPFVPIYTPSSFTENYPQTDIESAATVQVVTQLEKQSTSVYKKQLFSYYGAVSNMEGLGFLGFRATMRTNWHDDSTPIISTITKSDVNLRGAITESFSVLGFSSPNYTLNATASFISRSTSTYNMVNGIFENPLQTNKVFKLKLTNATQINGLDNTSAETTTTYDLYNNPVTATTLLKEDDTTVQTTVSSITYKPVSTTLPYLLGLPASKTQSITANDDVMTSEDLYTYNATGLLNKVEKKGHNTPYITETNTYSTYGSITKKTITATGISRTTSYLYDITKRFIAKATDVLGLATTYSYNPNNGLLNSETNPYGLTTSYEYDSWFKKTKTTDYLGKTNSYAYLKEGINTKITSEGDPDEGSYSEELYDDLGRKTRTGIKDIQGVMSYKHYKYDIYDRNYSSSEPYYSASTPPSGAGGLWNTTQYDEYGRPIIATNFTGKTISMAYDKLTTTVTDSSTGKTKASTKNAMGNVVKMVETPTGGNPQTVDYSYYANGNLKKTDYSGTKITITQDGWGRKTQLVDPSAGTYSYTYNNIGETLTETTPNGKTTHTLDSKGITTKKTILGTNTSSNTVYTYDTLSKLLLSTVYTDVLDTNKKITTLYTYDDKKRIITTSETSGYGAVFTKTVSYDDWGRVDIETSTASLAGKTSTTSTQNTYKNGFAYQIKDYPNTKTLWETSEVNARGQLTKAKLGNNIEINNLYDNSYLTNTKHDLLGNTIMELGIDFNPQTGNLKSRKNSLFGNIQEEFGYDNQDRLISYPNAQGNPVNQTYKDDGRIDTNTLGTYNYGVDEKKYRNISVTLTPEATGYYINREGVFSDSMEVQKGWSDLGLGWEIFATPAMLSYDTTMFKTGAKSLKISNPTTTEKTIHSDVWTKIDNTVATSYTYSAWVRSDGPQAQLFLMMKTENETEYNTLFDSQVTNVQGEWVRIEETFLVPANIKKLNIRLDNNGLGNVWFDDVMIRKMANDPLVNLQIPDETYKDRQLVIDYNTFKSPVNISEAGVDKLSFVYNSNNDRSVMFYGSLDATKTLRPLRKYYSADGSMEIKQNIVTGAIEFITYLGGDGYSAPVVYRQTFQSPSLGGVGEAGLLYLHRDYQGSILAITNDAGVILEKRQFDAWGSLIQLEQNGILTPLPLGGAGGGLVLLLDRGYTGHEHLQSVGLINMNGRLYDPKLHRFLQPDNYVQDPNNTQNYNRYGYCINNPLKYTDKNGEFFGTIISALVDGLKNVFTHGVNFNNYDWNRTSNAWKIDMGLFKGNFGQIFSRFTWEAPQTFLGWVANSGHNIFGGVKSVSYYNEATVVETYSRDWGAFTLGSYIMGERGITNNPNDYLFQHEYGHVLQSHYSGLLYLPKYAIPSLFSKGDHASFWTETDANVRALSYFTLNDSNFKIENWDFKKGRNEIPGYDPSKSFDDPVNQKALLDNTTNLTSFETGLNNLLSYLLLNFNNNQTKPCDICN
jgi:RHS repeat-associated protein